MDKWIEITIERIKELTNLPYGWDGEDGSPLSHSLAEKAISFLNNLNGLDIQDSWVAPIEENAFQIEWRNSKKHYMEIEFHNNEINVCIFFPELFDKNDIKKSYNDAFDTYDYTYENCNVEELKRTLINFIKGELK